MTPQLWRKLRSARARRTPRDAESAEADLVVLARRFGAGELLEVEWNAARAVLLERIAAAEAASTLRPADVPDVKDLHAAWRRGELSVQDKRRVLAAVVERITINRGVRGRSFVGNRPEDRVVITWRSTVCTAVPRPADRLAGALSPTKRPTRAAWKCSDRMVAATGDYAMTSPACRSLGLGVAPGNGSSEHFGCTSRRAPNVATVRSAGAREARKGPLSCEFPVAYRREAGSVSRPQLGRHDQFDDVTGDVVERGYPRCLIFRRLSPRARCHGGRCRRPRGHSWM